MILSAQEINAQLLRLPEQEQQKVFDFLKNRLQPFMTEEQPPEIHHTSIAAFSGILKDSPNFKDDPLEIQRRMRDEWR